MLFPKFTSIEESYIVPAQHIVVFAQSPVPYPKNKSATSLREAALGESHA